MVSAAYWKFHIISHSDLINIFEVFLPQLLRYPNPTDPLNGEAAALLMRDPAAYESKVLGIFKCIVWEWNNMLVEYSKKHATMQQAEISSEADESEEESENEAAKCVTDTEDALLLEDEEIEA